MIEYGRPRRVVDDGAFSTAQAAEVLGVTRRRVQAMIKARRLEAFKPDGGRDWRVTRESVERYREERDARLREKEEG